MYIKYFFTDNNIKGEKSSVHQGFIFSFRKKEDSYMKTGWLDYTILTLVIIGAVNWGLIGFFQFDLVSFIFGNMSWLSRIIYALVGISGLYMISTYGRIRSYDEA